MNQVPVIISGELEVRVKDLPDQAYELIRSALTVFNEERQKKLDMRQWGAANDPEWIPLWREERRRGGDHVLLMPRGFAAALNAGMAGLGHQVVWEDRRSRCEAPEGYYQPFLLRDYQLAAAMALLASEQGVYESPAGSGKTITILGALAYANQCAVVIVDKANLLEQWRERASKYLGLSLDLDDPRSVGKIGEDVWEERPLTIALRQTFWSRLWELEATDWFKRRGAFVVDEVHHAAADTLGEIIRQAGTWLLLGASATPAKTETKGKIVYSLIGPIVARTTRQELYDRGVLVKPVVEAIYTGHDDVFWPAHETERAKGADGQMTWVCQIPNCRKNGTKHSHRDNYSTVLKNLVESPERARLIAQEVVSERGHVHLIPSSQLKHLDILKEACVEAGWDGPIYMLRGEENADGLSQDIATAIEAGGFWELYETKERSERTNRMVKVVKIRKVSDDMPHGREALVFSTVAGEGLDIPPIDRVHIVFPMKQEAATVQLVGRGERITEGKTDSIIKDYRDRCVVFAEQAMERDRTYRMAGYEVKEGKHAEVA
jgi:superfamily II DNA or RNA helicase